MATAQPPALARLLEFQHMLLAFRAIERRLHIPPGLDVFENDAEHSYALAMNAWFLAPHFPHLDRDKLIRLSLAHDINEGRGWQDRGISFTVFCNEKNKKVPVSPEVNAYCQGLIQILEGRQHLFSTP